MATVYDYPALVATQDNQRIQMTSGIGSLYWGQLYASPSNAGTVWFGGALVAQNRGIPIYKGSSFFLPSMTGSTISQSSIYFFFEKNGDTLYAVAVKD